MSLPAFIDVAESEQASELRVFLKAQGAEISEETSEQGIHDDLEKIIQAANVIWKLSDPAEIEGIFNSILSLLIYQRPDHLENLAKMLSDHLVTEGTEEHAPLKLRVLNNLFYGVGVENVLCHHIFCCMLKVAAQGKSTGNVETELEIVKKWTKKWELNRDQMIVVLRLLYEALKESKKSEASNKVMVELLGTYTEDNASQARDEAQRCIVNTLADPKAFLFDHLLTLRPVRFLEGELIHELLNIFVSGKLDDYIEFFKNNQDFIKTLGLSHDQNMQKMRVLTFVSMAIEQKEIPFSTIESELKITSEEVEGFIINVVKTKMVRARIDQLQRKVTISYVTLRTFGKQQWQQLREHLVEWQKNLGLVQTRMENIVPIPIS
ncbi:eukaryotic translation initiation factor 3 subunit M-like [Acanthaster planci]|uniref:Eukaryotic translation initiation factor 3 subunit M n=1 Tax=Acanthaster planci TaxID=133434 RepID=A0A8B7XPZ8_ACAPL|nr:eukaryotic translation initiation factor 3 subunit M-like [Acanthaster planci]